MTIPLIALLLASCADLEANTQGRVQPQAVSGPCQVQRFYLLGLRSVPTQMTVRNTGEACTFILINPALNVAIAAALVTGQPQHGRALAQLISGDRQAAVSYAPMPGYVGPDRFEVTLEPNAVGITVNVTVQP
ncbi:MAG TPA: hypothetical protein VE650_18955 [Acetobacteraceae bacterium]|jgi:hypothetical protein|nr:hypothetical protein [Acetobacteraceae bacterium]